MHIKKVIAAMLAVLALAALAGCTVVVKGEEATPSPKRERGVNHELQTFEGNYQGLADNNFFEVQKEGEEVYKVFMITPEMRADFESLDLLKGDRVRVEYIENSYGQLVTILIEKTDGDAGETDAPTS